MKPQYVVIPTTASSCTLRRTLQSLVDCKKPDSYAGVIVAENGVQGKTEAIVREMPPDLKARYLYVPAPGKNRALNAALQQCGDALIVFSDDDVRYSSRCLELYADRAVHAAVPTYFGGPTGVDYDVPPPQWLIPYLPMSARGLTEKEATDASGMFLGFNWAAYSTDIVRAGGFDSSIGPGACNGCGIGDESDMQQRLRGCGVQPAFVPNAYIYHYVPPERCSPEWTLNRWYQSGVFTGLQRKDTSTRIFGYPRWLLAKLGRNALGVIGAYLTFSRDRIFEAKRQYHIARGWLRGARLAIDQSPTPMS